MRSRESGESREYSLQPQYCIAVNSRPGRAVSGGRTGDSELLQMAGREVLGGRAAYSLPQPAASQTFPGKTELRRVVGYGLAAWPGPN